MRTIYIRIKTCDTGHPFTDANWRNENADFVKITEAATEQLIKDIITLCEDHYELCHYNSYKGTRKDPILIADNSNTIIPAKRPIIIN